MRAVRWPYLVAVLSCLVGCLGDPVGPGGALAIRRLSPVDSVLVGAPGRPIPTPITFQAVDAAGRPVPGAAVTWTVAGTDGRLDQIPATTDARGEASVLWFLGTKASEDQRLTVQVAVGKHHATATLAAIAKPVEVRSISFADDTMTVKLGLRSPAVVQATDPFGNRFVPAALQFVSLDTTLFCVDSVGMVRGRKRGWARVVVAADAASDTAWVHTTQIVQTILASPDTLRFHSLGQTATLDVHLIDDQGRYIRDSLPGDSVAVDAVVSVMPGRPYALRSMSNGRTPVILRAGPSAQAVQVMVYQQVASVKLAASGASFDALGDTARLAAVVSDSLGVPLANQMLTYFSGDTSVATVGPSGLVTAKANGSTWMYARTAGGAVDSLGMVVAQRVARVVAERDSILLDALQAAVPIRATALDRLGSPVAAAALTYATGAASVATVDAGGQIRAIANGTTVVTAAHASDTALIAVRVAQRPVRVVPSSDTVRFVALGDTRRVTAEAVDSLGSPVPGGVTSVLVHDTAVVDLVDSLTLRARGNGVTKANVSVAGLTAQVDMIVDQVPTTLTAAVTFGNPVVTLPVGAPLPLSCRAFDKNGFLIPRDAALLGSVHGTVSGTRCSDARVQRSGYDTLLFALGPTHARVPVIVATAPDSVGVVSAAQPLSTVERIRFVGEDLAHPSILALRPLVADILAAYGNPTTNLDRARAIRDWVARTAIYPDSWVRPDTTTSNLSVLPAGKTWFDVNRLLTLDRWYEDVAYWQQFYADGYLILDRLLGTLDQTTGRRAEDGMMEHVAGARYRIRDVASYRYLACSFQSFIVNTLWAAAGLHGMEVSILNHDPAAVFIPELGRWVYEDPTYNEEYLLDGVGEPLSPLDLLAVSTAGQSGRLHANKMRGPSYDPAVYPPVRTYLDTEMHPEGMIIMGAGLYRRWVGDANFDMRFVQVNVPALRTVPAPWSDPSLYVPVTAEVAFPMLGPIIVDVRVEDSVKVVRLASTFPDHQRFERRLDGHGWETVGDADVLPVGACRVEYRSVNAIASASASAVLDVWVPRGAGFVESGFPGSVRSQARYCN